MSVLTKALLELIYQLLYSGRDFFLVFLLYAMLSNDALAIASINTSPSILDLRRSRDGHVGSALLVNDPLQFLLPGNVERRLRLQQRGSVPRGYAGNVLAADFGHDPPTAR